MIVDRLDNRGCYGSLPERWQRALEFLADPATAQLPLGRHDLDGDNLFALIQEYDTRPADVCRWEAHRRYVDVQYVASGCERIGIAALEAMTVDMAYDEQRDVGFFHGTGDWVTLPAGSFAIFLPHDVHRPCVQVAAPSSTETQANPAVTGSETLVSSQRVRKIVVKAALDRLHS
ncbi:MAG: YhcH/YjgK/YiaL family protein [Planctomycetota bacterium]